MKFRVHLTDDAKQDLEEIADFLLETRGLGPAEHVVRKIGKALESLKDFPERGPHPPELLALGNPSFRQAYFKPYRLIYRIDEKEVYVYLIADGRRDMQSLLIRRLFKPG